MPDGSGYLFLNAHHLIIDALGMSIFVENVRTNYLTLCNNIPKNDNLCPSYLEFIEAQNTYLESEKFKKDKDFWENQFEQMPNTLFFKDLSANEINCNIFTHTLSPEVLSNIKTYCSEKCISENVFMLTIFSIYFSKLRNLDSFILGNPALNRANYRQRHTSGMFVAIMPFIINTTGILTFEELCSKVAADQKKMYRHLSYPYEHILEYTKNKHNHSQGLYDVIFSYQNFAVSSYCKWYPDHSQIESLQIHIKDISAEESKLTIHYDYLTSVFSNDDIILLNERILHIINQVTEKGSTALSDIDLISKKEKQLLLNDFNNTDYTYNKGSNIAKDFEKVADMYPNNVAVKDSIKSYTYKQLNNVANIIANKIHEMKIENSIIAFSKNRSSDIIPIILGILKSGNTYMPIDPEYPLDRIQFMLKNSNAKLLISTKNIAKLFDFKEKTLFFDDINFNTIVPNLNLEINPSSLCYIMYTSGSTGIPKAVSIKHYNVLNFVKSMQDRIDYNPKNNISIISVTTICFDIFVFEVFPTILSGLTLFIANELESKSPKLLSQVIEENNISKILTTPSRIELLFSDNLYLKSLKNIKYFILGGEPLTKHFVNTLKAHTNARIFDLYGPTETTVYSTFKDLTHTNIITIGKPIYNTKIYILNKQNSLTPINSIGEICIGGDGVGARILQQS